MERKKFGRDEIDGVLRKVSADMVSSSEGFIIGGLAMMRHGVKLVTKDVDLVFRERGDAEAFINAIESLGYVDNSSETITKPASKNSWRMVGPGNMRFDVFLKTICKCLVVSDTMASRAEVYSLPGNLRLKVISPEDIFLFKSVTDREDDLADMRMVAGMGLDWDIIEKELRSQPDFWNWVAHHFVKLGELEDSFGIHSPLKKRFARDAEIAAGMARLRPELEKRPLSVDDARRVLKERTGKFGERVLDRLVELGMVQKIGKMYSLRRGPIRHRKRA